MNYQKLEKGLPWLPLSIKMLFTGYLLTIGLGLLMAGAQIMLTHGMADGKPGLSIDDIVYSYYGNRNGSTLEAKLNSSMKNNAPPEVRIAIINGRVQALRPKIGIPGLKIYLRPIALLVTMRALPCRIFPNWKMFSKVPVSIQEFPLPR